MDLELSPQTHYCEKCNKTMNIDQFYKSNDETKYTDGYLNQCKKCITMHVDNWTPDTYLWILQEIDVPYVPKEWNSLLAKYTKGSSKVTGMSVLGRYLSKMKLKQYKDFRWKDTEHLQEVANMEIEQAMKRQGFDAAQIDTAIRKATFDVPTQPLLEPEYIDTNAASNPYLATGDEDYFASSFDDVSMFSELTDEDKLYLRLKWGKPYKLEEQIELEKLYNEMMESYDIQSAGHVDTLKMVCKTSLKANQLLDVGDIDGAQKMIKMYDQLMKSGKFTAAQNKAEKGEYVDSISELVAICESDGFIPRYYTDGPQDKVDRTIQDIQRYTKTLIMEETNLGVLIEKAVKDIQAQKEAEAQQTADAADDEESFEAALFDEDSQNLISDADFADFRTMEDEEAELDDNYLRDLLDSGDLD